MENFRGYSVVPISRYTFKDAPVTWFEFGRSPCGQFIDIADGQGDVLERVPVDLGLKIIDAHNLVVEYIEACHLCEAPEVSTQQRVLHPRSSQGGAGEAMTDTTEIRDEICDEIARLQGWKDVWHNGVLLGWYRGGCEDKHRCEDQHPVPDTIDAAIEIIERDGWKWCRDVWGTSRIIMHPPPESSISTIVHVESGNLRLDFFTAAMLKLKAIKAAST